MDKVNLAAAFDTFTDHWRPRVAGDINDVQIKLVKLAGAFDWHHHEHEDEAFLVVEGTLRMELRDRHIDLGPGELLVVPHGVEHRPVAISPECKVVLIERNTTLNTGTAVTERTAHPVSL